MFLITTTKTTTISNDIHKCSTPLDYTFIETFLLLTCITQPDIFSLGCNIALSTRGMLVKMIRIKCQ